MDTSKYTELGVDSEMKSKKKGYSAKGAVEPDSLAQRSRNHRYKGGVKKRRFWDWG